MPLKLDLMLYDPAKDQPVVQMDDEGRVAQMFTEKAILSKLVFIWLYEGAPQDVRMARLVFPIAGAPYWAPIGETHTYPMRDVMYWAYVPNMRPSYLPREG